MLAVWLIISSMLYSLRLSNGGSFPKPLTAREEREYLDSLPVMPRLALKSRNAIWRRAMCSSSAIFASWRTL